MIVFGIHFNFMIVLPIRLKTCRSIFFFFLQGKMCRFFGRIPEVLHAWARPMPVNLIMFLQKNYFDIPSLKQLVQVDI